MSAFQDADIASGLTPRSGGRAAAGTGGDPGGYAFGRRRSLGAASSLTVILAVLLLLVVALVVWEMLPSQPIPSDNANQLTNTGPLIFVDVTAIAGLDFQHEADARGDYRFPEEMGAGGAFLDYDSDGDMDIYLVQGGSIDPESSAPRNRMYRNEGNGQFVDVSRETGTDISGYGMGVAAADYDNDGDVDLFVTRVGSNVLLQNDGSGSFTDVTEHAGVGDEGFGASATFFDLDGDGLLDLYVTNYVDWSTAREMHCFDTAGARDYCSPVDYKAPSADRLYRNLGGGAFEDISISSGVASKRGNGLGVVASDFDGDGWVDLYVANDQTSAFLWMNQHDGTLVDEAALRGCAFNIDGMAIAGMGVAVEDLDGDQGEDGDLDMDIFVTNIFNEVHLALRNDGGRFEDVSYVWGLGVWGVPYTGFGIALFDQDHDGSLDGIVVNGAVIRRLEALRPGHPYAEPNQFIRRDASGRFFDATAEVGLALTQPEMSRAAIIGDYDNDGDVDVLITNNRGPVQLLRNDNDNDNAWVMLILPTAINGRTTFHTRVVVETAGRRQVREFRPQSGYLSSNDPRLHFGLGAATTIDRIVITLPGGKRWTLEHLPVNTLLTFDGARLVSGDGQHFDPSTAPGTP